MDETDFKKLVIGTPFDFSYIRGAYGRLRDAGISDEALESLLPRLIKMAIDANLSLAFVVKQFCEAGKYIEWFPATQAFDFPQRIIFFCDCNAKFDSAESLKLHGAYCPEVRPVVANGHYPTRDGIIAMAEEIMKKFFEVMPETSDLALFLLQITKVEFLRRQGKVPADTKVIQSILTSLDTPYTREQGIELMEEVSGWFGVEDAQIVQFAK